MVEGLEFCLDCSESIDIEVKRLNAKYCSRCVRARCEADIPSFADYVKEHAMLYSAFAVQRALEE